MIALMSPQKEVFDIGAYLFQGMSAFAEVFIPKANSKTHVVKYEFIGEKTEKDKYLQKVIKQINKANKLFDDLQFEGISTTEAELLLSIFNFMLPRYNELVNNIGNSNLSKIDKAELLEGVITLRNNIAESIEALEIYADEDVMNELNAFINA